MIFLLFNTSFIDIIKDILETQKATEIASFFFLTLFAVIFIIYIALLLTVILTN